MEKILKNLCKITKTMHPLHAISQFFDICTLQMDNWEIFFVGHEEKVEWDEISKKVLIPSELEPDEFKSYMLMVVLEWDIERINVHNSIEKTFN